MKKLLVIESDKDLLDLVTYMFHGNGFEVVEAKFEIQIEQIVDMKPDVVLIDYRPHVGSRDLICLELKRHPRGKHIPVVLYSTYAGLDEVATASCADAFIGKPFNVEELLSMILSLDTK